MKKLLFPLCVALAVSMHSCTTPSTDKEGDKTETTTPTTTKQEVKKEVTSKVLPLEGYFLKNDVVLNKKVNFMVIDSQEAFDKMFGMAKTMNNTISKTNFMKTKVGVIAVDTTAMKTSISIDNATMDRDAYVVNYTLNEEGRQSYVMRPLSLFYIPNNKRLSKVTFKSGDKATTVPLYSK